MVTSALAPPALPHPGHRHHVHFRARQPGTINYPRAATTTRHVLLRYHLDPPVCA